MRLSILIPTYNCNCVRLVTDLQQQLPEDCEILVADDASTDETIRFGNRSLKDLTHVTYWEEEENHGRSGIRNLLARKAQGDYLLFIDSDAEVKNPDYIQQYLRELPTEAVVCGGALHSDTLPSPSVALRWAYEKNCEPRLTADKRREHPHQHITTFNILMPRCVALAHPFNERITRYGYEDTLLGRELERDGIAVLHIDNPLIHLGLDTNELFLHKTEEAMRTLYEIRGEMEGYSRLLTIYKQLEQWHLTGVVRVIYQAIRPMLQRNLLGKHPSIWLFNFYKLGYYITLSK